MSNILHIIQGLSLGGAARSMIATSKYSSRFGNFRHSVISLLPAQPDAIELAKEAGMSMLSAPDKHTLFNEIERADIIHFNWWNNPEIYELLRSELPPMRLMIWYHVAGNGPPQIITPQLVNFADMNIPCNPFTYNELPIFRDIPHEKKQHCVEMVYDAADFERLKGIKLRPHNHFNVGYIGTVDFVKMHKNYIRMSASVNVPDVKFIVCGGGIQDQLRNQAMNLGVEKRFDFRGYVNDIKPVIEILDIYGYPLCEGTYAAAELTLQEVMYAGIPPVVFPYGGIKQLVKHEETGLVIHSESEYKEAIEYLFHHPEERTRLGRNALEYAKQIFGAENAAKKLNCVYEKMMRIPKKKRNWNSNGDLMLQNQVIHINKINENQKSLSGADKFIEALGNYSQDYITSMHSQNIHELFKAEKSIASSHPLLSGEGAGGILNYKNVYQHDGFLRLWSGLILQQKGNHAEAVTELASATKFGCNHWRVFWYLAQSAEKLGNYALTKKALQIVTQAAPEFIDAGEMLHRLTHHDNTINTLHHAQNTQEGKRSEAREILNNLLNKWPANTDALNNLAEIEILEKNWEKAAELLQRVLEHDPANDTALKNIQLLEKKLILYKSVIGTEKLIEQKQYSEAREILKKILEIDNKHVDALNNLAVIEIIEKNYIPARSLLEKVLNIDSTNEIALENIACINRNQTSYSPAIGNESSVKIDVSIVVATKNRAKLLDEMFTSLKNSAQGVIYEVIVVEGGSSDNTLEVLRKHGINQIYNEFEYFGEGKHSWPQLYNFGFSKAKGKWAMYASDDIVFNVGCISKAVELLDKQNPEVAGGVFFYKNVIAEPGWDRFGIDFTYGQKLLMNYGLVRLDYFREVNGFDENYKFYCADGDLCLKFYEKRKQLIPLPGCFVVHNNVMDNQKKSNLNNSTQDIELYIQTWKHFVTTKTPEPRRLLWNESGQDNLNLKGRNNVVSAKDIRALISNTNTLDQLRKAGVWNDGQPLRLHLGCGERQFDGYINIDYSPVGHTVQTKSAADVFADITTLHFPDQTVDEIRLHHVFEHFDRPTALALLCRWNQWLKIGGSILIETPDFEASLALIESPQYSYKQKQGVLRHIVGSHEAEWAVHKDCWYKEKYQCVLSKLGFCDIRFEFTEWKMTRNIVVYAKKQRAINLAELQQNAKDLLRDSMIDETPSEEQTWRVWCHNFDSAFTELYDATTPKVSIFIPVYNSEKYLAETLDSILAQTFQDFEIIIADDGSHDKSLEIARIYENRDRRIKVLSLPHNGEVKARNEAIKHTNHNSKYLLNHDSDDISLQTKLERLVEYLETHPEIGIVGCFAEYFNDEGNYKGQPPIEWQSERIRETFGEVNSMINSAALIRREVFYKIEGYREEYRSVDDYDFFARALIAGFELANIPKVLHRIRLHPASVGSIRANIQQTLAEKIQSYYKQNQDKYLNVTAKCRKPKQNILHIAPHSSTEKLSVLHTVEFYYPHKGGAEIVVQQISERLIKRGHLVTIATTKLKDRTHKTLNGVHIEEFSITGSIGNGIRGDEAERYKEFLLNHSSDVMMNYAAQQWATDLAFEVVQATRGHRVNIIAPCGYSALSNSRTIRWPQFADYFNRIIPTIVPQYDAAIYHSALYQDYEYAQNHGFTNSIIIPNAVDEEEFLRPPRINFREKYNIKTSFLGLCVANFYEGKGQERVIECVKQMNRPDFTMVFIGKEGAQLSNLKAQAAGMNVRFFMDIPREDTLAAYHEADIFLFGSYVEASPLVIIEAKASKTPFVSTDCGNVREWKGGIVCAPEDMAIHANNILDNENLRIQLVNEGYREWEERLTWESIVDKYEELYVRLVREKRIFSSKNTYTQDTKSFSKSNQFQDNNNESIIADLSSDLFNKAEAFSQNGAYNEAIHNYKKAIESNPSFYDAYDSIAIAYAKLNQTDNAIIYLEKAIRLRGGDASVYNNLGVLYFKKGMCLDAKTYFEIALLINVNYREAQQNLEKVNNILNETPPTEKTNQIIGLIFSKDRAMQLDGTLRSFYMHCKDAQSTDLTVIYKTSNALHDKLYDALKKEYSNVVFIKEKDFKEQVLPLIRKYTYVLFLVDDNIFVRDFYITNITRSIDMNKNAIGFSLRLGENTVYCYALNAAQKLPMFSSVEKDILKYDWVHAELDFGYPLEVSSSMYRVKEIYPLLAQIQFSNPNTLENQMAANKQIYVNTRPILLCGKFSFTFCAPLNIVQNVCDNRVGSETCYSSETLANKFGEGYRIAVDKYMHFTPNACHQEVPLELRKSNL